MRHTIPLLKALSQGPLGVFADAARLFLCKGSQQGQQNLALACQGVDVLTLETNRNAKLLQVPGDLEKIHCIACEPADGLGQDDVNLSKLTGLKKRLEARAVDLGSCDSIIREDTSVFPIPS